MTFFMPIANLINVVIENWMISVAVLAVFASLCLGLFKGAKHGIRAMAVFLVLAILWLCAVLVYYFIENDVEGLIKFGIAWLPTIIFLMTIILSTLVGIRRGLRKSLILMLHSVLAAGICLGLFFFCVNSSAVDKALLKLINTFMGTDGLQSKLGISADCETLRQVLMELFSGYVIELGEIGILLGATSAYVETLVNMAYHIAFAIVFFLLYELLLFIMYIIYLTLYPERKYKKKRNMRFAMNKADSSYHKRPVGGGCVGLIRGLVGGIVSLSFIGSIFFIAVGGTGASRLPEDISFGENYNPYVSIYRSIESYGDQGIFKILNSISDPKDTPYYLFAADIVFSGGLNDKEHDVKGNIKFREELAAYTGFAKNTFALLMKYDTEGELDEVLRGKTDGAMDKILNVFSKPEFRVEFDNLIDNFDSQTYIINFALSLTDAVITNIDDMSFMSSVSADNKELLKVMFSRNYLSDRIPDERERKKGKNGKNDAEEEVPPYFKINHLLTKRDAQLVLNIVLSVLSNEIDVASPQTIADVLVPNIEELSIISSYRSKEVDPVLGRLYCFLDNLYLTDEGEDGITYAEVKNETVKWTKEIRALISVADGLATMYGSIQNSDDDNLFNNVSSLFDESNPDRVKNSRKYEKLVDVISDSALMSKVLCSQKIYNLLSEQLKNVSKETYLPQNISYENKYDSAGKLISHGEAYHLLRGLRLLSDDENKPLLDLISDSSSSFEDLLKQLSSTITKEDPRAVGNSLASYLTESTILRSVLSSIIIERAGDNFVVPTLSLETYDEHTVNIINRLELREILDSLPDLVDLIIPIITEEEINKDNVNKILQDDTFNSLINNGNKIIEGTIAKSLIDALADNETVIISKRLEEYEEWVTVGNTPGELRHFLRTKDILSLDIGSLLDGASLSGTEIFDKIKELDEVSINQLLESEVFHYSSSDLFEKGEFGSDNFQVIVPLSSCIILKNDKLERVIIKEEMAAVFLELNDLGLSSEMNSSRILRRLVEKKEAINSSIILSVSVVNFMVGNQEICTALSVPQRYMDEGTREKLDVFDSTNPWRYELPKLIDAIDESFEISITPDRGDFTFNSQSVSEKTATFFRSLDNDAVTQPATGFTRLDVCYASEIYQNRITEELDKYLNDSLIEPSVRNGIKTNGVYEESEISALKYALDEFGMKDFTYVGEYDFSGNMKNLNKSSSSEPDKTKISVICRSDIATAVLTKRVNDTFKDNGLIYHTDAEREYGLLKEQELNAVVSLLGDKDLSEFEVGSLSVAIIRNQLVADNSGNPRSYLISANFTDTVISKSSLYVPSSVYKDGLIIASEAVSFVDAVSALQGDSGSIDGWNVDDDMVLPDSTARKVILESEIMRATFSHTVFTMNDGIAFAKSSIDVSSDRVVKGGSSFTKIAVISSEQLDALFEIVESCTDGNELKAPSFKDLDSIRRSADSIDLLCGFDGTRYNISQVILSNPVSAMLAKPVREDWYMFTATGSFSEVSVEVLTTENILDIINL